jgi:uncharacterized membrane protein YccC
VTVDVRAVHRALRVAGAVTAGFLVGRYVVDDPQAATYGALTPIALLVLGEVGGSAGARLRAYVAALCGAAVLVVVGTVVSDDTAAASVLMFVVALVVSLAAVAGPNATGLARALILVFVVSCGIPAADDAIPARLAGLAVGGACAAAAALVLWPEHPGAEIRRRLGQALRPLAQAVAELAGGKPDGAAVAAARAEARASLAGTRTVALDLVERPTGTADAEVAERRLGPGLARLERELASLPEPEGPRGLAVAEREYLQRAADELACAAEALAGGDGRAPSDRRLAEARLAFTHASQAQLAGRLADGQRVIGPASDAAFAVGRVGVTAEAVVRHAGVATDSRHRQPAGLRAQRVWRRLVANLGPHSVVLQNAVRLALALAVARAVAGFFDLSHGFWVVFATLSVTRASARRTGASAVRAVAGTLLGAAIATPLILIVASESDVWVVLLPVLVFLAVLAGEAGFVLGQAGFTLMVVALFSLVAPPHWDVGLIRLGDVAVGAALGVVCGLAAWPRGPGTQLRQAIAAALDAAAAYERAAARHLLGAGDGELAPLARHAREAITRAEDVLIAYLGEIADRAEAVARWGPLVDGAWRRTYACEVIAALPPADGHGCAAAVEALDALTVTLETRLRRAAEALRRRARPHDPEETRGAGRADGQLRACIAAATGEGEERREAVVALLACRGWIDVAGAELSLLDADVARVAS